ncbi:MAG: CPBP family intramembrane glutamic endopeptidase [Dehalococcoidia bacterium]
MAFSADSPTPPSRTLESGGLRVDWTGRDVLTGIVWFVGIFVGGQILVAIAAIAARSTTSNGTYATAFVVGGAVEVGIGVVAMRLSFGRYGGGIGRLGLRRPSTSTLGWALAAFVAALVVSTVYGEVITRLDIKQLQSSCAQQIPAGVRHTRWLLALASVVVIAFAPVFEELFFRGFVFPGLARAWGVAAAIVVSGLLFSSAHLDYKSFIPIAGVGMVFAFTYWRSGNIFSTMLAHGAFNSTSIAFIAAGACEKSTSAPAGAVLARWLVTIPLGHWL